jgi:hypothetical protein
VSYTILAEFSAHEIVKNAANADACSGAAGLNTRSAITVSPMPAEPQWMIIL